jgi:hypothetical protein
LVTGTCLGKVEATSKDITVEAKKYIGMPCMDKAGLFDLPSIGKKLLPVSLPGVVPSIKGTHVATLWSICDCNAENPLIPTLPDLSLDDLGGPKCKGPLCALIPKLSIFGVSLKDLQVRAWGQGVLKHSYSLT